MADWKNLLKDVLLADGTLDAAEADLLRKEILADGVVDFEEVTFLVELRNAAGSRSDEFESMFFESLSKNLLADGMIDDEEAARLRQILFADGVIDEGEKAFLRSLKQNARSTSAEFDKLFRECVG